jgi:hypothetical protein
LCPSLVSRATSWSLSCWVTVQRASRPWQRGLCKLLFFFSLAPLRAGRNLHKLLTHFHTGQPWAIPRSPAALFPEAFLYLGNGAQGRQSPGWHCQAVGPWAIHFPALILFFPTLDERDLRDVCVCVCLCVCVSVCVCVCLCVCVVLGTSQGCEVRLK